MPNTARAPDPWWLDAHLDLAYLDLHGPSIAVEPPDPSVRGVSLAALARGDVRMACATIFTELGANAPWGYRDHDDVEGAFRAGVAQLERYEALERGGLIRIARRSADLIAAAAVAEEGRPGPLTAILLMECADPIRSPDDAAWWHARGVRLVGLSWGAGSRYSGGNARDGGITPSGRALVQAFDALGIVHDASHLSDRSFEDLCACSDRTIVATHSNARARLAPSPRHLSDAQMKEIARRDGMVGLNLYGRFLASGRTATLDDALDHVEHAASIVGRHRIGLGSDFDGGFAPTDCPAGCGRPEELGALLAGLEARGWNTRERVGFAHGNWMRVLSGLA